MPIRPSACAALLLVLATAAVCGAPVAASAGETPTEPPVVTVLPANDKERTAVMDLFAKAAAEKSTEPVLAALTQMATRKCDDFVPEIRKYIESDQAEIQAAAIVAASSNGLKDEEKRVRKILHAKPKQKTGTGAIAAPVAIACIQFLTEQGIAGEQEFVLDDWLKPTLADERKLKQDWASGLIRACIAYFGRSKWMPSVPYLIEEMLGQPIPSNPNDPKCPPASYWEARTRLWQDYEGWARWALKEITGQQYRSVREWQAWMKTKDKKAFK